MDVRKQTADQQRVYVFSAIAFLAGVAAVATNRMGKAGMLDASDMAVIHGGLDAWNEAAVAMGDPGWVGLVARVRDMLPPKG